MQVKALQDTFLKKSTQPSTALPDNQKSLIKKDQKIDIESLIGDRIQCHQQVKLKWGAGDWFLFCDHFSGWTQSKVNASQFFASVRALFQDLTQPQVDGFNAILSYWESSAYTDKRWLAYCLATAWHETGTDMQPIREGFTKTNAGAIAAVTDIYNRGIIDVNYALPESNGNSYYGRGLVQITWPDNYLRLGKAIGLGNQLYDNPDLALNMDIAVKLLFVGSVQGLYTSKKLSDYFNDTKTDWFNARRIINGLDKAADIELYAQKFFKCL